MNMLEKALPLLKELPKTEDTHEIIAHFSGLPLFPPRDTEDKTVERLRGLLRPILATAKYAKIAHGLLLLLAEYLPRNTEDCSTLEPIEPEDAVYTATGNQYSLTNLVASHYARPYRGECAETPDSKWLVDPLTNERFPALDEAHILQTADQRIPIEGLKKQAPLEKATPQRRPSLLFRFLGGCCRKAEVSISDPPSPPGQ